MIRTLTAAIAALLICGTVRLFGQDSQVKGIVDAAFATASVDGVQSAAQSASNYWDMSGIGRGYGIDIKGGALIRRIVALGGNVGFLAHSDSQSSTVATTAGTKGTSVSSSYFSVFAGVRTPPLTIDKQTQWAFTAGADLGRSWAGSLKKSVPLCTNCGESSVDVIGGSYYEPLIKFANARGLGFGFAYRVYAGKATLGNMLLIRVGLN